MKNGFHFACGRHGLFSAPKEAACAQGKPALQSAPERVKIFKIQGKAQWGASGLRRQRARRSAICFSFGRVSPASVYNDHRMAKSIEGSIDFAAKRQVWQRMIYRY